MSPSKKRGAKTTAGTAATPDSPPDYEALVHAVGDVIYTLDMLGVLTYLNPAGTRVLGYSQREAAGRHFLEFLTPDSARVAQKHFAQGLRGTESTPFFEVEALHKSGIVVNLEIRAGPLYRDGVLVGRQGIARDISELKRLQGQVAEKSERLTLLEERNKIAMSLYARIAGLAREDHGEPGLLRQVDETVSRVSAEKFGLSASDLRILDLLADGRSNPEIATALSRSPNTVKDRVTRIMQRLGAKRRAEVVAIALNMGLISNRAAAGRP